MTSRLESTLATRQDPPIDYLDIVATQGAYLVPRTRTPVFPEPYDDKFAAALEQHLHAVKTEQICRSVMYHGAADEWPMGHTPPELKDKRKAELKVLEELEGATSDDNSDNEDENKDKGGNDSNARVGPGKSAAAAVPNRPWLPSPPLSAESPLATLHRRKRRRTCEENEEEIECPAQKVFREALPSIDVAVLNAAQKKGWKRRRTVEVCDGKEGDKEWPSKMRSVWLQRLRPRPRRLAN